MDSGQRRWPRPYKPRDPGSRLLVVLEYESLAIPLDDDDVLLGKSVVSIRTEVKNARRAIEGSDLLQLRGDVGSLRAVRLPESLGDEVDAIVRLAGVDIGILIELGPIRLGELGDAALSRVRIRKLIHDRYLLRREQRSVGRRASLPHESVIDESEAMLDQRSLIQPELFGVLEEDNTCWRGRPGQNGAGILGRDASELRRHVLNTGIERLDNRSDAGFRRRLFHDFIG